MTKENIEKLLNLRRRNEEALAKVHEERGNGVDCCFHSAVNRTLGFIVEDENTAEEVQSKMDEEVIIYNALNNAIIFLEEHGIVECVARRNLEMDLADSQGKISAYAYAIQVLTGALK